MTVPRILSILILSLFASAVVFGQTIDEGSNWYKEIGRGDDYYSSFDFTRSRYSITDLEIAKTKYLAIASAKSPSEWEGSYTRGTFLGSVEIIWNRQTGFVYHSIYHSLRGLNYGRVIERGDSVWFISEKPAASKTKGSFAVEYIKVRFGERHLLVPKEKLKDFAEIASGRDINSKSNSDEVEDNYYWEMIADRKKPISSVPTYTKKYTHLIRQPIATTVKDVSGVETRREKLVDSETNYEQNIRRLTFSSGTRHGIRIGMRFWIPELEEWGEVVSVSSKSSVAELSRPIIDGKEYCDRYENQSQIELPCRAPQNGMNAHTKTEYF